MEHKKRKRSPVLEKIIKSTTAEELQETRDRMRTSVKIFDAMSENGVSYEDLAKRIGVTEDVVRDWTSGTMVVPTETLEKICNAIGTDKLKEHK